MVERLQNAAGNLAENEGMEGMEGGGDAEIQWHAGKSLFKGNAVLTEL